MKHTISEVKLKNGAQGLLIHIPGASVMTFDVNFRAGDFLTEEGKWETAHLMEHVLLGANQLIPKARKFQAEFEKNGAYTNASTSSYDITYEAECADFEWDRILELLLVAITKPLFLQEEFDAEFGNVREELTARGNNHFRHLSLALREAYGFAMMTDQNRLKLMPNVTLDDVRKHYKKTHYTSNMRFVIAGNIKPERRKHIKQVLDNVDLPVGDGRIELPMEQAKLLAKPLQIPNKTVDNVYFYLDTFMNRRMRDPEADALSLINTMFTETLYSRIFGAAREKGLVYGMSSGFGQTKDSSNLWFGAQVSPQNAPALFSIILKEVRAAMAGKIKESDLTDAKQYALGRYQRSGQTVGGTSAGYSYRYFFDDEIDDYYKIPERIRAVSRNRIETILNDLFAEKIWGLGVLGNLDNNIADKIQEQVTPLWNS